MSFKALTPELLRRLNNVCKEVNLTPRQIVTRVNRMSDGRICPNCLVYGFLPFEETFYEDGEPYPFPGNSDGTCSNCLRE